MRSSLHLIFCLSFLPALGAQDLELSVLEIPAELKEGAHSVVRKHDLEYTLHDDANATLRDYKLVTLLNEDHGYANYLAATYDNDSKITKFSARAYNLLGVAEDKSRRADIVDRPYLGRGQFYEDTRYKQVSVACESYPCTVELEYVKKLSGSNLMNFPAWMPQGFEQGVENSSLTVTVPADNKLSFVAHQVDDPVQTTGAGGLTYRWRVANLPPRKEEVYAPNIYRVLPNVHFTPNRLKIEKYAADFSDWEGYGKFMEALYRGRRELPPGLGAEVDALTQSLSSDREKITALYKLLQERTRYVGIQLGLGGFQPFSAKYVHENRFGDCKALTNFMMAMLDRAGVESYPVIIYSGDQPYEVPQNMVVSAFNHVVLYVPGEKMYLECTSNSAPVGYLGSGRRGRRVVHVTPGGGRLVTTPPLDPARNGYRRRIDVTLDESGNATYAISADYLGTSHEPLRELPLEIGDPTAQADWLHEHGYLPDVSGSTFALTNHADAPEARLEYATELPRYARSMGKRLFLPLNKYPGFDLSVPGTDTARQTPIAFDYVKSYRDTVVVTLPANRQIESLGPGTIALEHAVGDYKQTIEAVPNGLIWTRELTLRQADLPAGEYNGFRDFFVEIAKAERRQVVVKERRTK